MNNYYNPYYYGWYQNEERRIPNISNNSEMLENPKEGFEKGNMFMNLYDQYKNYKPMNLTPRDEQEKLLYNLLTISFAAHELNLYLDLHPEDQSMLTLFNDYKNQKDRLTKEYEEKYGPLTVCTMNQSDSAFNWTNTSWPWEGYNV